MHNNLPDETQLPNGQKFELLSLALLGVPSMAEKFLEVSNTMKQLSFDPADYVCLKFILLLNQGIKTKPKRMYFYAELNSTFGLGLEWDFGFRVDDIIIFIFFSAEVRNLNNRSHVQESSEQVHQILMEYCHNCYPNVPVSHHSTTTSFSNLL